MHARYALLFCANCGDRTLNDRGDRLVYAVTYEADPVTGNGYVYLPGRETNGTG